jgi:hypothetical protein
MGASDRFLFSAGTIGSTSRVLAESTPGGQPMRSDHPPRSSTVLQRCRGPVQLSLFAGLDALPRAEECESPELKSLMIERRLGGRRSTD